jgi:heavy metal sensor kinase
MRRWWQPRSVRTRLALWHLAALIVVLALYSWGVFALMHRNLMADMDRQLGEDLDRAEVSFQQNPDGTLSRRMADVAPEENESVAARGPWTYVWTVDGRRLYRDPSAPESLSISPGVPASGRTNRNSSSLQLPDGGWVRCLTRREEFAGLSAVVRVARSEDRARRELRGLLMVLVGGLPVAAVFAGLGGYLVARRALRPIDRMVTSARRITAASLSDRLPVENPDDELGHLASVFNETFGRLEASFDQLRRFTADASHEMRTPLTTIRTVGEVGLQEPRSDRAYRDIVGSMLEEADRLNRLVESLLTLARADGGHVQLSRDRVDVGDLAREVAEHLSVLAEERRQSMSVEGPSGLFVKADRLLLRHAVINLLDNAIKYSPVEGRIQLVAARRSTDVVLEVRDSGPGIPPEHTGRIFDRFYRIDKARSRDPGGVGLGLSIARWAVEVQGGRIDVESPESGGSVFRIVLPGES